MTVFGVPWEEVEQSHVVAFLDDAGDEGLTWEAKGTERPRKDSVRKHSCGFANAIGGFYIVGARREGDGWIADGVDFGSEEPGLWLGNVLRSGLDPVPRHDVKSWPAESGAVAVMRVDPVAVPPCMTASAEVFERVSGATLKVHDPATLRRLFQRGEAAVAAAEAEAARALGDHEWPADYSYLTVSLAFAPTGKPQDVTARLFSMPYEEVMIEIVESLNQSPLYGHVHAHRFRDSRMTQNRLRVANDHHGIEKWSAAVNWDASAFVSMRVTPEEDDAHLLASAVFDDVVAPAADAAARLISELGGYGRAHVILRVDGSKFQLADGDHRVTVPSMGAAIARTWTADDGILGEAEIHRMRREIYRAIGIPAYEP